MIDIHRVLRIRNVFKKNLNIIAVSLLLAAIAGFTPANAGAEVIRMKTGEGGIAIWGVPRQGSSMDALNRETVGLLKRVFNEGKRLRPIEDYRLAGAISAAEGSQKNIRKLFHDSSISLGADAYVVISVTRRGTLYEGDMQVVPLSKDCESLGTVVRVKSRIMMNIPLKLARHAASIHKRIPLSFRIVEKRGKGFYRVNAGQWHGLEPKFYRLKSGLGMEVVITGRYESLVKFEQEPVAEPLVINKTPEMKNLIGNIDGKIEENTIRQYGIGSTYLKGQNAEKRYIEGMCIVNPGGNICLPGYGAFLATHYLGFKGSSPDVPSVVASATLLSGHFLLIPAMTEFRGHFFPWVQDNDKSDQQQRLHVFCWISVPLTMSVAYMDQLAYQFHSTSRLPPFFSDRDVMAGIMSVLIPGGGMFYKGRRLAGWGFYVTEMMLAGYGISQIDGNTNSGGRILLALGLVKIIDIAASAIMDPVYAVYRNEIAASEPGRVSLDFHARHNGESGLVYILGIQARY